MNEKQMNDIQKEINMAFRLISSIPVRDDAVDYMAAAREHLRNAFNLAEDKEEQTDE